MVATADLLGQTVEMRTPKGAIPRWETAYGYGKRQLKNWLARGREVGEMPPFDEPVKMPAWAARHLGKCPAKLREAVERLTGEKAPEPEAEAFEIPDVSGDAMGVEAELLRFRRNLALTHRLHEQALREKRFSDASRYMEQAKMISGEVRQLEKLVLTLREQSEDWHRAAEVKTALTERLNVLFRSLMGRGLRASARLRSAKSDAELDIAWRAEIQAVFAEVCANGFAENFELQG